MNGFNAYKNSDINYKYFSGFSELILIATLIYLIYPIYLIFNVQKNKIKRINLFFYLAK